MEHADRKVVDLIAILRDRRWKLGEPGEVDIVALMAVVCLCANGDVAWT